MKRWDGMVQMLVGGMLSLGVVRVMWGLPHWLDGEGEAAWFAFCFILVICMPMLWAFLWLVVSGARHWRAGQREALGGIVAQATMPLRAHAAIVVWLGYFALFNFLRGSVVESLELELVSSPSYLLATRMAGGMLVIAAATFRVRWAGEGLSHSGRAAWIECNIGIVSGLIALGGLGKLATSCALWVLFVALCLAAWVVVLHSFSDALLALRMPVLVAEPKNPGGVDG